MRESTRNGIRRSVGWRRSIDAGLADLRERLYRKDINAWNPGRKLGSAERRTLPSRFLSFSSCRDSLSPQCDDRVCTTMLRYRKIRSRWLEKSRPTIKEDNNFLRAQKQCCLSKDSVKICGTVLVRKKNACLFSARTIMSIRKKLLCQW